MGRTILSSKHKKNISRAMRGNKNVFGKKWVWSKKSKDIRKKKWAGKSWSPSTQFKKGNIAWNKGQKMSDSMREKMKVIASKRIGKKGANWIDGRSFEPYPAKFNNILKKKIKERDNYECKGCGIAEKDYFQKLSIHHLDYNKENCTEENLVTLCRGCNGKANAKRYRERSTTIIGYPSGVKG